MSWTKRSALAWLGLPVVLPLVLGLAAVTPAFAAYAPSVPNAVICSMGTPTTADKTGAQFNGKTLYDRSNTPMELPPIC